MTIELNLTSSEVTFCWGDTDIGTVHASDLSAGVEVEYVIGSMEPKGGSFHRELLQ